MLYLAFPTDLRERYKDSEWLVYAKQIHETQFTPEDTVVLSGWVVHDRAEQLQIMYRIRQQGARVIYVGPKEEETDEFKRQLCLIGIYDFVFFGDEVVLGAIDQLIEYPRTPADVREYMAHTTNVPNDAPTVVDVIWDGAKEERDEPRGLRGRFKRASRWGGRVTTPASVQVVQPRLLAVTGLWPRAGVSTITYLLSKLLAENLPPGAVSCIEHPRQWPRMWDYFQLDERVPAEQYRHWTQDGIGQSIDVDGVSLVPLPPGYDGAGKDIEQQMIQYIFRQMRRPVTVLDCGQNIREELLFSMVDRVVCVMDCDPTYLSVNELGKKYQYLSDKYGERLVTVLNKWTRFAEYDDLFKEAVKVPYLPPAHVQQALWEGAFIKVSDLGTELQALTTSLVQPFLPS
ncbi:MAG: adenylyl-sulfate kinase [Alicyclobacillus sp.]|nr:adenylyl-sulfate kinase [Alicyclobacillus sp.]